MIGAWKVKAPSTASSSVFFGPLFLAIFVVLSLVILFRYVPIFDRF